MLCRTIPEPWCPEGHQVIDRISVHHSVAMLMTISAVGQSRQRFTTRQERRADRPVERERESEERERETDNRRWMDDGWIIDDV